MFFLSSQYLPVEKLIILLLKRKKEGKSQWPREHMWSQLHSEPKDGAKDHLIPKGTTKGPAKLSSGEIFSFPPLKVETDRQGTLLVNFRYQHQSLELATSAVNLLLFLTISHGQILDNRQIVLDHLICSGFRPNYLKWVYHGEDITVASTSTTHNEEESIFHHEMLNDIFEMEDNRVNPTQFKELVTRWFTSEFQSTCAVKRTSREKIHEPHVTGTKSFARLAHEMAINNNGVYPSRGEMYVTTRTRKDGSIVDDKVVELVASLKAIGSDSISTPRDSSDITNDNYSKVKGPEKRGYVRLVGRIPAAKKNGDSSSDSQTVHQLKSVVNVMANIIQEHIPNANLSAVLRNMNIEVPSISSVPNNSISVNQISPVRSQDNNGNH
ncbi:unnamed protein product [Lactuca virosa]|uniref:Transposase-associated domain-containing protein n=1 Tax=Lactuca virosa TaxID=75947 RepID=A0AAU9NWI3_9ASTR|nr:unnamed protein product [Lactuca virosa]